MRTGGSTLEDIRQLPKSAWVLLVGTFVYRFGSFVLVFLVLYLTNRGFSAFEAGLAVSVYGVGSVVASILGGYLADRIGRRDTIAISMFLSAVTMLTLSQAVSLFWIVLLTGVAGFSSELYRPPSAALLTDLTAPGRRVTAFALYRLSINLGMAIGPAVGGLMAQYSFTWLFVGDAATSVVFGLLAIVALPGATTSTERITVERGANGSLLRNIGFQVFLLATLLSMIVYVQAHSTFALQVTAHGHSRAIYGLLLALNGLMVVAIELPMTTVTRRHSPRRVMAIGMILTGIGFGLTGIAEPLHVLVLTVITWTLGEIIYMPVASAFVADHSPRHMRGRYQGAWGLSFGLGFVLGPVLGTLVFERAPAALWPLCLSLALVSAVLVLIARPRVYDVEGDTG